MLGARWLNKRCEFQHTAKRINPRLVGEGRLREKNSYRAASVLPELPSALGKALLANDTDTYTMVMVIERNIDPLNAERRPEACKGQCPNSIADSGLSISINIDDLMNTHTGKY